MIRFDWCRLEAFAVVTTLLYVSDGRTEECGTVFLSHRKQGDFAIELDKFFNDEFLKVATTT